MNCILMDIKKFLKKLETGQLEIEAGQWELHKDITNLKNTVQDLRDVKKDLYLMKQFGLAQTTLIKELQSKLTELAKSHKVDKWSSTSCTTQEFDKKVANQGILKGRKKNKNHSKIMLRSGKAVAFKPQDPLNRKQSVLGCNTKNEKEFAAAKERRQKGQGDASQTHRKMRSHNAEKLSKSPPINHSILQRYLQDSARYVDRQTPQMSYVTFNKSSPDQTPEKDFRKKCNKPESKLDELDQSKPDVFVKSRKTPSTSEKFNCLKCPKKFGYKSNFLKHERELQKTKPLHNCNICNKSFLCKNRLKKHEDIHHEQEKSFRGFRCSYCYKICKSPDKLTEHLKNCRIITKKHTLKK